ncbi:hypothetical protein ACEZCY_10210 [Streptacidiphilus sp. N1-12]|uniref:Uncharacterized protein n=2 Tax=Streptacidiphilus alkalitolerans TaxID=3342712 RepID=A0ABV6V6M6_9ACTN
MSLNRAVAALGAVAVVGALTVGFSVAHANSVGKPVPKVYVTSGSTWVPISNTCYNDGKVLTSKQLAACVAKVQKIGAADTATPVKVHPNTTFTIGVDKQITDKGWSASGTGALVAQTTKYQANNLPLSGVFATNTDQSTGATTTADKGTVLIVERKSATSNDIYGVWMATLKTVS